MIKPSDSYTHFLVKPTSIPAPQHIKKLLPKYRITHFLGAGGFADVYEGTDDDERGVAIKVPQFKMEKTMDSTALKRFASEAEIWKKLQHENIVKVYETGSKPLPHIVMELMEGGDLDGLMRNHRLTVEEAVHIMVQILEGISYAHQMASVHRDLKPENILFTPNGNAKITDWGIGKYMASEGITKTIETKGTLAYSAPEQFDCKEYGKVDWQTDIFQLGILFYELLTGVNPFLGKDMAEVMGNVLRHDPHPPSELNSNIPTELDEIVMTALEKIKKDRWDSSAVMLHELKLIIKGKVRTKRRDRKAEKSIRKARKQVDVLDEIYRYLGFLEEFSVDIDKYKKELEHIEGYAKLRWYEKVRDTSTPLLKEIKDEYDNILQESKAPIRSLIDSVRELFEECISRNLKVDELYPLNEEAMEALDQIDLNTSEELFKKIRKELDKKIDIDKRKIQGSNMYKVLKKDSYDILPPHDIEILMKSDIDTAIIKLREWESAIMEAKKRKKEQEEEKRLICEKEKKKSINDLFELFKTRKSNPPPSFFSELIEKDVDTAEKELHEWERTWYGEIHTDEATKRQKAWAIRLGVPVNRKITIDASSRIEIIFNLVPPGVINNVNKLKLVVNYPFYIGIFPVTQNQWKAIMGYNPSKFKKWGFLDKWDSPVEWVSWHDCQSFIHQLNQLDPDHIYRLPTELRWEYACSAGNNGKFCFGDDTTMLDKYAWFKENSCNRINMVGMKKPNKWGLYDMHGNVWEWTSTKLGSSLIARGGSWNHFSDKCMSAFRSWAEPEYRGNDFGFRIVCEISNLLPNANGTSVKKMVKKIRKR